MLSNTKCEVLTPYPLRPRLTKVIDALIFAAIFWLRRLSFKLSSTPCSALIFYSITFINYPTFTQNRTRLLMSKRLWLLLYRSPWSPSPCIVFMSVWRRQILQGPFTWPLAKERLRRTLKPCRVISALSSFLLHFYFGCATMSTIEYIQNGDRLCSTFTVARKTNASRFYDYVSYRIT